MKSKILKILGIGLTLALTLVMVGSFALPAGAAVEKLNEWYKFGYPDAGSEGDWFRQGTGVEEIDAVREITQAINGDLYVNVELGDTATEHIFKSEDGGRSWADTSYDDAPPDGVEGGRIFDMVCSSIDEDVVYATDGCYVYKTDDGGDTWDYVAKDSLETVLMGTCGEPICCGGGNWRVITSIDVTYDDDDNPFVFIGTREHDTDCSTPIVLMGGDVYYIGEGGYPANWTSLNLACFHGGGYEALAVGCAPDWAETKETYVVVTTDDDGGHTWVIYTKGTVCGWYEFAELLYDCKAGNDFESWAASRIGFPDDWEDTETLFVGITDENECTDPTLPAQDGGDVYMATDGSAIDLNVEGITTGCKGIKPVDIISLDVQGDTEGAELIAGSYCCNEVYYSTDGGWSWDESEKDPTGERLTYVIWYEGSALAATTGDECAVSMSCVSDEVEEVGEAWNQISLIATDIDSVLYIDHSPGYVCEGSETMFMLTYCDETVDVPCQDDGKYRDSQSLFRYDGTYWERVFTNFIAGVDMDDGVQQLQRVRVSPDFNTTNAVYVTNRSFEMWRSLDAGCSWDKLTFPCSPRDTITATIVIDEDTVIAGGEAMVYKTTRHGARPWDDYELPDGAGWVNFFALEPGYEDPGAVLLGDDLSQVFISEDGGETWDLVGDPSDVFDAGYDTWVIFDPGYATNHIIYAAAGGAIARCTIDADLDWADQEWEEICCGLEYAAGIAVKGDTALYVTDSDDVYYPTVDNTSLDEHKGIISEGGVLRSLNPDAEDADDVVFERIGPGLEGEAKTVELRHLWLTCGKSDKGCAENVLWSLEQYDANPENIWVYEDTLAAPVVLGTPVEGQKLTTTDEATLSWTALCGADCYEVSLYSYCPECPDQKQAIELDLDCCPVDTVACGPEIDCDYNYPCTEETCIVVDDLDPGTKYYWQVRVCQGKPTLSKWSEEKTFTTALMAVPFVDLCSPACGSQDIILTPNFAWGAVKGATGYEVQLATTETFTVGVVKGKTTVNAWVCPETLEYATTYYWRVKAVKDGIYSDWTYCMFTTMAEPVPPTPPVVVTVPPAQPAPVINIPAAQMITPKWIYAIIGVGAALAIVVIALIVRTRRPPA